MQEMNRTNKRTLDAIFFPKSSSMKEAFFAGATAAMHRLGHNFSSDLTDDLLNDSFNDWNKMSIKVKEIS